MALRFAHVNVRVKDPAAALRFYRALGLDLVGTLVVSDKYYLLYLAAPGDDQTTIELTINETGGSDYSRSPGSGHFALSVGPLDACVERLRAAGYETEQAPFHPGERQDLRICFIKDPDGHAIELIEGDFPVPQDAPPPAIQSVLV